MTDGPAQKIASRPAARSQPRVLVAGAGGVLGRLIVRELLSRGTRVRAVLRRPRRILPWSDPLVECRFVSALRPGAWSGPCDGVDAVISCLGASVNPSPLVGWRSYTAVDAPANRALLEEARRARVQRFVYVSLIDAASSRHMNYSKGHELVVDALRASEIPSTVLRPTGFFAAMAELVRLARHGFVPLFGDGACRTNPIHEADVARAAVDAIGNHEHALTEIELGGPETLTRRQIAELAFESLGKPPRLLRLSPALVHACAAPLGMLNPRAAHFARFAVHIMTHDCLAPPVGTRRLGDYFRAIVEESAG